MKKYINCFVLFVKKEWGQIVIMDYLINYIPENSKEAEM